MKSIYIADKLVRSPKQYPARDLRGVRGIVLHHTKGRGDPYDVARNHVLQREWPGHGYHFQIVGGPGASRIFQTNELDRATYHAGLHNRSRIGVAVTGDYDMADLHPSDLHACAWLCAVLCRLLDLGDPRDNTGPWLLPGRVVSGHRELWGATRKVGKTCPGERFDLGEMRERIASFDVGPLDGLQTRSGIEIPRLD